MRKLIRLVVAFLLVREAYEALKKAKREIQR